MFCKMIYVEDVAALRGNERIVSVQTPQSPNTYSDDSIITCLPDGCRRYNRVILRVLLHWMPCTKT